MFLKLLIRKEGVIYHGGLLRFFHGFRVKETLQAKYHFPVAALNDGKAAALAELATGHLKGVTNGAALVLGSGLGGGIIINGKLFQGSHFQAGELTFLLPLQMEKLDPSLMQGTTLSAVGLITKVNEILASLDLKDGLLAFKAINAKKEAVYPIFETYCRNLAILGPGKVLCGFNKRIDRKLKSLNVENIESLEKTLDYFKEVR